MNFPQFTKEELEDIAKIPMPQMQAHLNDMMGKAKHLLFKHIEAETGTMPPDDYMLTHEEEFAVEWVTEGHAMVGVWFWKNKPVVRQRGILVFDGTNLNGSVQTDECP